MGNRILDQLSQRLESERSESDASLFHSLLYFGEALAKLTTALFVAAIEDNEDRTRYAIVYRLLRSDGIGDWTQALDQVVMGAASEFLIDQIRTARREYSQKVDFGEWQSDSVACLVSPVYSQTAGTLASGGELRW